MQARRSLALTLVTAVALCSPESAEACTCVTPPLNAETIATAPAIFSGRVTSKVVTPDPALSLGLGFGISQLRVTFALKASWKGEVSGDTVAVMTGLGGGDCGYPFEEGERYLVYAWRSDSGQLDTHICTYTKPLSKARRDIRLLRLLAEQGGRSGDR